MSITGTQFSYFMICHRKLWLFSNGIQMEHTSDLVYEGKLIHETSYPQRSERYEEIEVAGIKIDYFDRKNMVVHEVKKSDKIETAHEWQLKYYIFVLEQHGLAGVTGVLEYPALRKTDNIYLSDRDRSEIVEILGRIQMIITLDTCPQRVKLGVCKNCSYFDFCWVGEDDR